MLGDQAGHQSPLVGDKKVVLQTSNVLQAQASRPAQPLEPGRRYAAASRPELGVPTDQQSVRPLSYQLT